MVLHTCNICGSSFSRSEHLSRHKLSHSDDRPFECSQCNLPFSRRDTLQRHMRVHNMAPTVSNGAKGRAKRACQKCSQTKLRCDGDCPCGRCRLKGYICLYNPSRNVSGMPKVQLPCDGQRRTLTTPDAVPPVYQEGHAQTTCSVQDDCREDNSHPHAPIDPFAHAQDWNSLDVSTRHFLPTSSLAQPQGDMTLPLAAEKPQQTDMQMSDALPQLTPFDLQMYDPTAFGAAVPHVAFWEDPEFMAPLYLDPHGACDDPLFMDSANDKQSNSVPLGARMDDGSESDHAPIPSFLGARQSPEPQHGQRLRLTEFFAKTWPDQGRKRDWARKNIFSDNRTGEICYPPPLMGSFSPTLSSTTNDQMWEAENLVHVKPLPTGVYAQIVAHFDELNSTTIHSNQFVAGDFPSLAACNAFMQLFFEHFNQLFPIIHKPSFDPNEEHWLLVLSVVAIGCRFSQQSAAVECADIVQEFVHRALQSTVCYVLISVRRSGGNIQVKISKNYDSTCEPWLAQSSLLNQIGLQFSGDLRLTEVGQSIRSLVASICRKVNCFNESERSIDALRELPKAEAWKTWAHRESMCRLAYAAWFVDGQYALYHDLTPLFPTELLRVQLPCSEDLWRAATASSWWNLLEQNDTYQPLNIRQELTYLYKTGTRRQGLGDFPVLLLLMGVLRGALQLRRSYQESLYLQPGSMIGDTPSSATASLPKNFPGPGRAMEYLQILCPNDDASHEHSSLKTVTLHHYHTISIILGLSLGELFCYCGFRVTSDEVSRCRTRLLSWMLQRGTEARQVAMHAGRLFGYMRQSSMRGYYEGRAFVIACQALWVFGELAHSYLPSNEESQGGRKDVGIDIVRLDQRLNQEDERAWILDGATTRPYLAGVGCILGSDGVARLIREGSRVLVASRTWGFAPVMGRALKVWHQFQTRPEANS